MTPDAPWLPNPGPQTDAVLSSADVLLYGGAGGGGKSDCLLGLAVTQHRRSLILRRQYVNLTALLDRSTQIVPDAGINRSPPPRLTTADGRIIDFGAAARLGDEQDWQGQPHDLLGFDEATQFLELQVRFLMGWVRSTEPGQRCRTVLATNPPLDASGDWIIGMFRPWLDLTHPEPAKPGELRWYVTDPDGKDMEVDGPGTYRIGEKDVQAMSRTFISAKLSDNPYLANTGYAAQLDALPEPIRSAVRDGNFMAARADAERQVIPTQWVLEAQARWTEARPAHAPMSCIACDVAQGGPDRTTLAARYDGWFAPVEAVPGKGTPDGPTVAGLIIAHRRNDAKIVIDTGGGYGGSAYDHLKGNGVPVTGFKGSEGSVLRTKDGTLGFVNKRSAAHWRLREALDPEQDGGSPIALPHDPELTADLTAATFKVTPRGIQIEDKDGIKKRIGRSPDKGDAVVMCWFEGPTVVTHGEEWRKFRGERRGAAPKVIMGYPQRRK